MYARVRTASLSGLESMDVYVEVDVSAGLPSFSMVGLVHRSIREAKERVHAAVSGIGYRFPPRRITVNLSPANRRKEGSHFDLPIAVGLLVASGQVCPEAEVLRDTAFLGELTLDGRLTAVEGVLPLVVGMNRRGVNRVVLPKANCREAEAVRGLELYPAETLLQVGEHLSGFRPIETVHAGGCVAKPGLPTSLDFADIRGQERAKRATVVAASGSHGLLLSGPPGVGKTMIGKRIPGILPEPSDREQLDIAQVYSIAGLLDAEEPFALGRPFRAPHHSLSAAAMTGGGHTPVPGEISLAHHGVLFLDELPEFSKSVLDTLRQPLEEGYVSIARVRDSVRFPADFMLVAAMNPCRCGYDGDPVIPCTCTQSERMRYAGKISGPLLDRIDLHIRMERSLYDDLDIVERNQIGLCSEEMRSMVHVARMRQAQRFRGSSIRNNADIPPNQLAEFCSLDPSCRALVEQAFSTWSLSARSYHRLLRVARTIADIANNDEILEEHVLEAMSYRFPRTMELGGE